MIEQAGDGLTLRQVLYEAGGEEDLRRAADETGADGAMDRQLHELPPGLRAAARDQAITILAGILEMPLVDVLVAGWRRWETLAAAARRTLEAPGETEIVELADHEITSTHRPHIDVDVDGYRVARIDLEIELALQLHGVTAVVRAGRLTALRSGRAEVGAKVSIEGVQVTEASRPVELPIELALGEGISLVEPSDLVTLPPAPVQEPSTTG
jgi:hypothetical protein